MYYDYPTYEIPHKCIVCNGILYSKNKEQSWNHIAHYECAGMARKFKKQNKHSLKTMLKFKGIIIQ